MSENPYESPQTPGAVSPPPPDSSSEYAACPNCGAMSAKPVGFTLWGGVMGPKMFSHVKCLGCKTKFNGKTGKSNLIKIVIYLIVSFAVVFGAMTAFQLFLRA